MWAFEVGPKRWCSTILQINEEWRWSEPHVVTNPRKHGMDQSASEIVRRRDTSASPPSSLPHTRRMSEWDLVRLLEPQGPVPISSSSSLQSFTVMDQPLSGGSDSIDSSCSNSQSLLGEGRDSSSPQFTSINNKGMTTMMPPQGGAMSHPAYAPLLLPSTSLPMEGRLQQELAAYSTIPSGSNSIPEFLYQLTKMLTDDNRDIIEWTHGACSNVDCPHSETQPCVTSPTHRHLTIISLFYVTGRIEVHNPYKLESLVLGKYFRHSKVRSYKLK